MGEGIERAGSHGAMRALKFGEGEWVGFLGIVQQI